MKMYSRLIRPLLFLLSPERVHRMIMWWLRLARIIPGVRALTAACFTVRHPSLEREVFGVRFPNPVGLAAGFDKDAECPSMLGAFGFGFVEVGTVTPRPQPGNPRPRLFRLPLDGALVNRMGFNNKGMDHAMRNLSWRRGSGIVGVNLGKNTLTPNETAAADYLKVFRTLYDYADYFVINVSCPNVAKMACLQQKESLSEIVSGIVAFRRGQNQYRPVLLKISPDLTWGQIDDSIEVMTGYGLDGIVATNTTTSRAGLKSDPELVRNIGDGGLSGAPLTVRAVEVVRYVHEKTGGHYPIIGVGGIMTPEDALVMLNAGASLVQVYTGFIYNGPSFVRKVCKALRNQAPGSVKTEE